MASYTFTDFCQDLKSKAAAFKIPNTLQLSINSFAVLESVQELNSSGLGYRIQDAKKPFFYCRNYEENGGSVINVKPPFLLLVRNKRSFTNLGRLNVSRQLDDVTLLILDSFEERFSNNDGLQNRTPEEIYISTSEIMLSLLKNIVAEDQSQNEALQREKEYNMSYISNLSGFYGVSIDLKLEFNKCDFLNSDNYQDFL
jgi:hypothetical protein